MAKKAKLILDTKCNFMALISYFVSNCKFKGQNHLLCFAKSSFEVI